MSDEHPDVLFMDQANELAEVKVKLKGAERRLSDLLMHAGDEGKCRGCGRVIFWVRHRNGKATPYDPDGTNHFATCPVVERFKQHKATCKGYTEKG